MYRFIRVARRSRQFPLPEEPSPADLLRHLNLLKRGRLTNTAMMLFGRAPQRFLICSEVKCAHFHGTEVAKLIPSRPVNKGTVFELEDQAVDFVMSKIASVIGTRAETVQEPVVYEIPREVVTEAVVSSVAHRDYTDNSSVQVMLFANRQEGMNSGRLPPPLTVKKLRVPHQLLPANPLIAESMDLLRYIEKMGAGPVDIIRRCAEADLPEPDSEAAADFITRIWPQPDDGRQLGSVHVTTQETQRAMRGTTQEHRRTTQQLAKTTHENGVTTQQGGGKSDPVSTGDPVLDLLRSHPTLRRDALASLVGITPEGVKYHLDKFREAGPIRHVGPTKKGRWEFLESESTRP